MLHCLKVRKQQFLICGIKRICFLLPELEVPFVVRHFHFTKKNERGKYLEKPKITKHLFGFSFKLRKLYGEFEGQYWSVKNPLWMVR